MSAAITPSQIKNIMLKSDDQLRKIEGKPRINRSSSINTIKKINTYICSPQSYILPAILTMWLKSGQNGLQSSTEKTIFMFRSVFFRSFFFKFLLSGNKFGGQTTKLGLRTVLRQIIIDCQEKVVLAFQSVYIIAIAFGLSAVLLTVQICLCVFYISQSIVPIGLIFLIVSATYIVILGHRLNIFYLTKMVIKTK